jgi:hypothetical protein
MGYRNQMDLMASRVFAVGTHFPRRSLITPAPEGEGAPREMIRWFRHAGITTRTVTDPHPELDSLTSWFSCCLRLDDRV